MIEAMGAYQRCYGLGPIGAHRHRAHELLSPLLERCPDCDGEGVRTISREKYEICATCKGVRYLVTDSKEFHKRRRQVLEEFPSAGPTKFRIRALVKR